MARRGFGGILERSSPIQSLCSELYFVCTLYILDPTESSNYIIYTPTLGHPVTKVPQVEQLERRIEQSIRMNHLLGPNQSQLVCK